MAGPKYMDAIQLPRQQNWMVSQKKLKSRGVSEKVGRYSVTLTQKTWGLPEQQSAGGYWNAS
jgi:hypothetical protein